MLRDANEWKTDYTIFTAVQSKEDEFTAKKDGFMPDLLIFPFPSVICEVTT